MPKELPIVLNPHPILRKKSQEISEEIFVQAEFRQLLLDMAETMIKKDGAGLAAPQVGQNIRAIVVQKGNKTLFMINPRLTKKSWAREIEDEGCLSVLNDKGEIIYGPVARHKKISCAYLDEKGKVKKISAEKILARVIQHEIDHLDGILFIDKLVEKK
ncbi:TPA: peptide deformylase [Candidatus Falkowbacteria bacterium]|jgi:peptide deformylase|nr:MAG: Peptide deformylase [Candidatus Falkowbacteria bacterium GW2011_GWF2_43_32]HBA36962.1 peptide deformylase [Candidatus Falkowbacteria bacterium]